MESTLSDQPGLGGVEETSDLQKLRYLNTVMMANLLLRQLKIPLYIHTDHRNHQVIVVADDGSIMSNDTRAVYTGSLDYTLGT